MEVSKGLVSVAVTAVLCACSPTSPPDDVASGAPPPPALVPSADPCDLPHSRLVEPVDAAGLSLALAQATPGTLIRLKAATYAGHFVGRAAGTSALPIVVCGSRDSVLDGGMVEAGYVVHLDGASHWVLSGFTVRDGQKGVVLDGSDHVTLTDLLVHEIGDEAVLFRNASSDNVLSHSEIRDTGLYAPGYGEGVYIGQWNGNWSAPGTPDRSDRNQILDNVFGPNIAAEHVDIKEGTSGGVVRGNVFDGRGMSGANYADSWVDVQGNGWRIEQNYGTDALRDGFQVHAILPGWGNNNVFAGNVAQVNGPGYGFSIHDVTSGNVVLCDNAVSGAALGFADIACTR